MKNCPKYSYSQNSVPSTIQGQNFIRNKSSATGFSFAESTSSKRIGAVFSSDNQEPTESTPGLSKRFGQPDLFCKTSTPQPTKAHEEKLIAQKVQRTYKLL